MKIASSINPAMEKTDDQVVKMQALIINHWKADVQLVHIILQLSWKALLL